MPLHDHRASQSESHVVIIGKHEKLLPEHISKSLMSTRDRCSCILPFSPCGSLVSGSPVATSVARCCLSTTDILYPTGKVSHFFSSSIGLFIKVSGVRNSWLTLVKKSDFQFCQPVVDIDLVSHLNHIKHHFCYAIKYKVSIKMV